MPLADLLPIVGALSAPAFLLIFAMAALGAPLLALLCLLTAALRSGPHSEAYARRLLRMALTCAVPALLLTLVTALIAGWRSPWLFDWLRAEPSAPGLFAAGALVYCVFLATLRRDQRDPRKARRAPHLGRTFLVAVLAVALIWLGLILVAALQNQANAVLHAPMDAGVGVAPLLPPTAGSMPKIWLAVAGVSILAGMTAGATSLEYMLLRRDNEPFGRDALANVLRLAARSTMRCALLATIFTLGVWLRLGKLLPALTDATAAPHIVGFSGANLATQLLLGLSTLSWVLVFLFSLSTSRVQRPWDSPFAVHACLLAIWLGLTSVLSLGLLNFYAG